MKMMITDIFMLLLAAAGGGLLGVFYFAGLRWTVRRSLASKSTALWISGSFLLRTAVILGGFYWIGAGDPLRMLACLAGFIVARVIVMKLTGDSAFARDAAAREAGHAS
jgi:F1F0 ATPase subunit 2